MMHPINIFVHLIGIMLCQSYESSNFCDISPNGMIDTSTTTMITPNDYGHYIFRDKYKWKLNMKCSKSADCKKIMKKNESILESDNSGTVFTTIIDENGTSHTIPANLGYIISYPLINGSFDMYVKNFCIIIRKTFIKNASKQNMSTDNCIEHLNQNYSASINTLFEESIVLIMQKHRNGFGYERNAILKSQIHSLSLLFDVQEFTNFLNNAIDKSLYINGFLTLKFTLNVYIFIVFVNDNGIGKYCFVSQTKNCTLNDLIENTRIFGCESKSNPTFDIPTDIATDIPTILEKHFSFLYIIVIFSIILFIAIVASCIVAMALDKCKSKRRKTKSTQKSHKLDTKGETLKKNFTKREKRRFQSAMNYHMKSVAALNKDLQFGNTKDAQSIHSTGFEPSGKDIRKPIYIEDTEEPSIDSISDLKFRFKSKI